ncbi:MAG TPA: outer membrane beta-barrel protein [Steroidobacteraceae bacterium]|nr:outer membrane beta-barrel protein [Steroidobacteraceae bacterium]
MGAAAGASAADDISYSYVDAGWVQTDLDDVNEDGDGFLLRGSVAFAEHWFASVGYRQISFDVAGNDIDIDLVDVGLGGHLALSNTVDGVARLSYVDASADGPFGGSFDDNGYAVSVGVRARTGAQVELDAFLDYTDLDDSGDDTAARLGARYYFTPAWAVGAEVSFSDDQTDFGIYGRFSF